MLLPYAAAAETWIIHSDGSGDFPTLQAAIDAIGEGELDTLLLGDGVFVGPGNRGLVIRLKDVHFESLSSDPATCIIDTDLQDVVGSGSDLGDSWWRSIGFRNSGTFRVHRSLFDFENCEFDACESIISCGWYGQAVLRSCRFADCSDIYSYWGDDPLGAWFYSCHFEGNQGGIGANHSNFHDCIFVDNFDDSYDAALFSSSGGDTNGGSISLEHCIFIGNSAAVIVRTNGWGIGGGLSVDNCVFVGNRGTTIELTGDVWDADGVVVDGCTFVGNLGAGDCDVRLDEPEPTVIQRSIFAFRQEGNVFDLAPAEANLELVDCDIFGNAGGDWVGPIADQLGDGCNMIEDPLFCDWLAGDISLDAISPCLPQNNDCGVLIGAYGEGCTATSVPADLNTQDGSWSAVKALY